MRTIRHANTTDKIAVGTSGFVDVIFHQQVALLQFHIFDINSLNIVRLLFPFKYQFGVSEN
jgi:hypothetical protein